MGFYSFSSACYEIIATTSGLASSASIYPGVQPKKGQVRNLVRCKECGTDTPDDQMWTRKKKGRVRTNGKCKVCCSHPGEREERVIEQSWMLRSS